MSDAPCNSRRTTDRTLCTSTHQCELGEGHDLPHECECGIEWGDDEADNPPESEREQ